MRPKLEIDVFINKNTVKLYSSVKWWRFFFCQLSEPENRAQWLVLTANMYLGTIPPWSSDQSCSLHLWWDRITTAASVRQHTTGERFKGSSRSLLPENLTCHLSFLQHLSGLTTASYKTYRHFCTDVFWHPYSVHVRFLTSVRPICGKENQTYSCFKKTVCHKRKSSDPDTLFPTCPSNSPTI